MNANWRPASRRRNLAWMSRRHPGRLVLGVLLVLAVSAAGCGSPSSLPKLHRVTGSVTYKDGKPAANASVLFASSDPSLSVSGDVQDDGSFTLSTVKGSEKASGAPEGEYRVTIQPPIGADHRPVLPIVLPQPYRVESKDNQFKIEVDPPRKP